MFMEGLCILVFDVVIARGKYNNTKPSQFNNIIELNKCMNNICIFRVIPVPVLLNL